MLNRQHSVSSQSVTAEKSLRLITQWDVLIGRMDALMEVNIKSAIVKSADRNRFITFYIYHAYIIRKKRDHNS